MVVEWMAVMRKEIHCNEMADPDRVGERDVSVGASERRSGVRDPLLVRGGLCV
jgi:hypothetical protein